MTLGVVMRSGLCLVLLQACYRVDSPGSVGDSQADASTSDGDRSAGEPCNDGTGATSCCPPDVVAGGTCSYEYPSCYTRCSFAANSGTQGTRVGFYCVGGMWVAGHGLFPCARQ
jgi:hypothetical protein